MRDTIAGKHKVDADLLFQKAKKQKTTAWILLGGGTGVALIGSILALNDVGNLFSGKISDPTAAAVVVLTGGAMMVSSIPFFVASGKNKSKAILMLKNEAVFFNQKLNINEHLIAVGVKMNL